MRCALCSACTTGAAGSRACSARQPSCGPTTATAHPLSLSPAPIVSSAREGGTACASLQPPVSATWAAAAHASHPAACPAPLPRSAPQCALIVGALWLVGDVGVRKRILRLLHQKGRTLGSLRSVLLEHRANLGDEGEPPRPADTSTAGWCNSSACWVGLKSLGVNCQQGQPACFVAGRATALGSLQLACRLWRAALAQPHRPKHWW